MTSDNYDTDDVIFKYAYDLYLNEYRYKTIKPIPPITFNQFMYIPSFNESYIDKCKIIFRKAKLKKLGFNGEL